MAFIKLTSSGCWWLKSKKDPRWNTRGDCQCGGFMMPRECSDKLHELEKKYGQPPNDLEWGYMKD